MTRDRKRGGHGFREEVLQALYLMGWPGDRVSDHLRVFYFLYGAVPGTGRWCEPDSEEMDSGEL